MALKPLVIKTELAALGRCNGMGELDRKGSYVRVVFHDGGENIYLTISEGCAADLIDQLAGALKQRDDAVLGDIMRDVRGV